MAAVNDSPRAVVVVGGASHGGDGLGAAISRSFAVHGDQVAIWDLDLRAAQHVAEEITAAGQLAQAIQVDVTSPESVRAAALSTRERMGTPTVLINSVGIRDQYPLLKLSPERWRRVMAVNLDGIFYCILEVGKQMAQSGGGVIINIGSPAGTQAHPVRAAYVASKHGLVGLTRSAAMDLAPYGIRVNCLSVSGGTTFHKHNPPLPPARPDGGRGTLLGKSGDAGKSAEIVYFFTTPAASLATGAYIMIDGGMSIVGDPEWRSQISHFEKLYEGEMPD